MAGNGLDLKKLEEIKRLLSLGLTNRIYLGDII
jgi:hypothetical protein